jgi:hypothetical protein
MGQIDPAAFAADVFMRWMFWQGLTIASYLVLAVLVVRYYKRMMK